MTQLEIILTIALTAMILDICLYFYLRPQYEYYEAEILVTDSNMGDILSFYRIESTGFTLRKSKRTGKLYVLRKDWHYRFGNNYFEFSWQPLLEPHLSSVQKKLERGEKIALVFE